MKNTIMKNTALFFLFIIINILTIACAQSESFASPKPKNLILAIGGESAEGLDPTLGYGRYGSPLFHSTLLQRDKDLNINGDLASIWTLSKNKKVWTVKIRKDVLFSNKKPLTAKDVAYTFNTARDAAGAHALGSLDKAEVVNNTTVKFHLKYPDSLFINKLATLGIVPMDLHTKQYARNPIGSGPYVLDEWEEGQYLKVKRNELYYGKKPAFEKVTFLFVQEDTAFALAKTADAHLIAIPQSFAKNKFKSPMKLLEVPSVENRGISFPMQKNTGKKTSRNYPIGNDVTADIAIRQAINFAIDRQLFADTIFEGFARPAYGASDNLPWDNEANKFFDNDIRKAKSVLEQNGWVQKDPQSVREKNGLKAEFTLLYPAGRSDSQHLALSVASTMQALGIQINLKGASWEEIAQKQHSNAVVYGWGSHSPSELYQLYESDMAGKTWANPNFYNNPAIDKHIENAINAKSHEEAIIHWKKVHWDGKNGVNWKGDLPWVWLVNLTHTFVIHDQLDIKTPQIQPHGHGWPITWNITDWEWKEE